MRDANARQRRDANRAAAEAYTLDLVQRLQPIAQELARQFGFDRGSVSQGNSRWKEWVMDQIGLKTNVVWESSATIDLVLPQPVTNESWTRTVAYAGGIGVQLLETGLIRLTAAHVAAKLTDHEPQLSWTATCTAPAGTATFNAVAGDIERQLFSSVRPALETFARLLESVLHQ